MGHERITLNFDTDDRNSMKLYSILQKVKRGRRMEVIADSILILLEEHNLLVRFEDNSSAMAKVLEMLSDDLRSTRNTKLFEHHISIVSASEKYRPANNAKVRSKKSTDIRNDYNQPAKMPCSQYEKESPQTSLKTSNQYNNLPAENKEKKYLSTDQWMKAVNDAAMAYFKENVPMESFTTYEEAIRMLGDDEEKYEELVVTPGLILNQCAPLPSAEMTFEEWLTKQLHDKGIYEESR